MPLTSLTQVAAANPLKAVRLIATDVDGTLTIAGKFTPILLQAFTQFAEASLPVLLITGRSAGWVSGLAHYLPVVGAIAENGGVFYFNDEEILLTAIADLHQHREKLAATFHALQTQFPQIRESSDNRFRLTDWTFDVAGFSVAELQTMEQICQTQGWSFTYSTVQCHIKPIAQCKAAGLLQVLATYFPQYSATQILTIGDSPNDESLFDARVFPLSVGVANVLHYQDQLAHLPTYVTRAAEGAGFCELAAMVRGEA